jgi:hypothetical protein
LNKFGFSQDKNIREFVLKKIGNRPLDLGDLVASMKPEEFSENRIEFKKIWKQSKKFFKLTKVIDI